MVTSNIQTERAEHFASVRRSMAAQDPDWNPLAHELYFRHETEIDNIDALLPEGMGVFEAFGKSCDSERIVAGEQRATDEECRKFRIDISPLEFDIEGEDVGAEIADKLQEFAAQLLRASIDIRYADLSYVEPDEGDDGDDAGGGESEVA